jgi:phosphopantetheine--protein transferase-like protein
MSQLFCGLVKTMKNRAINYFSKLLNSTVDENTIISLSSGQRARAFAWLKENNLSLNDRKLSSGFCVNDLLGITGDLKSSSPIQHKREIHSADIQMPALGASASIGVDIQSVSELFPEALSDDPKSDPELLAIYTRKELSYAQSRLDPAQTLTGLFAAKEAILKCAQKEINLTNIEILPDRMGRPTVNGFLVSISHSSDYAVAIATTAIRMENNNQVGVEEHLSLSNEIKEELKSSKMRKVFDFFISMLVLILAMIEITRLLK